MQKENPVPQEQKEPSREESLRNAKLFKFYTQVNNPRIRFPQKLEDIQCKSFYLANRKVFDKLTMIMEKYRINPENFFRYVQTNTKILYPNLLLNPKLFLEYAKKQECNSQYDRIYDRFMKSVRNIAGICVERNITAKEFMKETILCNRLAYEYISGRISKYFIASLQNFRRIYGCLDEMNKKELRIIFDAAEELNGSLQDACLKKTGRRVKPLASVEEEIEKIKHTK